LGEKKDHRGKGENGSKGVVTDGALENLSRVRILYFWVEGEWGRTVLKTRRMGDPCENDLIEGRNLQKKRGD